MPESHEDIALTRRELDLRCRILEIERRSAVWQCGEYRKILEQLSGDVGQSTAQPEGGGQPVGSSSQSAPATASDATRQRHHALPSLGVARQLDDDRERHQSRTSTPPELAPPRIVRRSNPRLENGEAFVGTVAALCADRHSRNRSEIFNTLGFCNHLLTLEEAAEAKKTPDIPWLTFTRVFGGNMFSERPMAQKVPAYRGSFLCTNELTQPFAPTRVGEPGVIMFFPGTVLLEDTKETFHVLVDPSIRARTKLQYCGIYTKVRTPYMMEVQPDEWHALPSWCRREWLKRLWRLKVGVVHARCSLRKKLGSEPSPAQIQEWLIKYSNGSEEVRGKTVLRNFDSGEEKFGFEVIKCVGYDVKLAKLIRNATN